MQENLQEKNIIKTDNIESKLSDSTKKTTHQKIPKKSKELKQDKSEDSVKGTNDKKEPKTKKYKQTTLFDF